MIPLSRDRATPPVTCEFCQASVPQDEADDHVDACLDTFLGEAGGAPVAKRGGGEAYHVRVAGGGIAGRHQLHLEVRGDAEFHDVDRVLRDLWLECCGHLSLFETEDTMFYRSEASARQLGGRTMETRVGTRLGAGDAARYEYDFGSTTTVALEAVSARPRATSGERVRVLARNQAPEPDCDACGDAPAERVCSLCRHRAGGLLCEACAGDHACDDHALSPLPNSPRAGVCGYVGPRYDPEEAVPFGPPG